MHGAWIVGLAFLLAFAGASSASESTLFGAPMAEAITRSDIAVVGELLHSRLADSPPGRRDLYAGDLPVEAVVFGAVDPGDTLEVFWEEWKARVGDALSPEEGYVALWLLEQRDGGGYQLGRYWTYILLGSEEMVLGSLRGLQGLDAEAFGDCRVRMVEQYLSGYVTGRRWQSGKHG